MTIREHTLFTEKYRPQTIKDCILPQRLKEFFQTQIDKGELQNILMTGSAGVGKTTSAKAMCNEMGVDVLFINSSENGNIDTLRTLVRSFASTLSFSSDKPKCIILDEADGLNPTSTQPALRSFIEEFALNARFILTCNFTNRIIEPIRSRCTVIDFTLNKEEKVECITAFLRRTKEILEQEGIEYDKMFLVEIIKKYFPDYRKILNELQRNSITGILQLSGLTPVTEEAIKQVLGFVKQKNFKEFRKWVVQNTDIEFNQIVRSIYERMGDYIVTEDTADLILLLNEYDYRRAFVSDVEIHTVAMLTQMMASIHFK